MMKKLILLNIGLLIAISTYSQKLKFNNAIDYNDYIVGEIKKTTSAWDKAIGAEVESNAYTYAKELGKTSSEGLKNLKKLGPFDDGYDGFRTTAMDYLKHMNKISKKELVKFFKLIFKGDFSDDVNKQLDALIIILDDQREAKFTIMDNAQKQFAKIHDFSIEE